ncbi:hypothetical protein EDD76_11977 [Kineothrix alysoides]|uniref:DoxX-like protein n=2 Tax=Kineothrix alysoides TaxID=1469948 RepID=A0A4V6NGK0_9FIRM|nr:hypothetical protein EDD76_11977 [Kineothrix alysoides]
MHMIYVIGVMLVIPAICVAIDYSRKPKEDLLFLFCKWFVFWAIGIRGITGGLMQTLNPAYTAWLLQTGTDNYIIIRELGGANLSFGVLGIISIFSHSYRKAAALSCAIFLLVAAVIHISRLSVIELSEVMSLVGDLFVVAIAVMVFAEDKKRTNKMNS